MTDDELHGRVVEFVARVTGVPTIQAYGSGPAPAGIYAMVNFTGSSAVRDHEQVIEYTPSRDDEDPPVLDSGGDLEYPPITATPVIEREWRFSVHAYGGARPSDVLRPIESAAKLSEILEPLFPDVVLHDVSQVRYVPEWINNAWEPRAQVDIIMRGLTRDGFVINVVDEIEPFVVTRA